MKSIRKMELNIPGSRTDVLLHACCAPCSSAILECMMQNGIRPVIYYCNPNIWPEQEYLLRKNECTRYAEMLGLEIVDDDYDHGTWLESVRGLESQPERGTRCQECFKYRLKRAAAYAHSRNIGVLTTTLASSRWKSLDQINTAGQEAVKLYPDVLWWNINWRKGGLQERRSEIIKECAFYNQTYCGCEFSMRKQESSVRLLPEDSL